MAVLRTTPLPDWPGPGTWIAASHLLGRPVPVDEEPHVCGMSRPGLMTGAMVRMTRRECPACPPPAPRMVT